MTRPTYNPPFIISAWCGPEGTLERYKEYADCGFNLVLGAPRQQIELAKAVGIKVVASGEPADVPTYGDDPTVVGIFLADEPRTAQFAELGELSRAVEKGNPRYIPYINLLPTYATPEQLGSPTYEEHVRKYIEICKPPFVSWDHYALYGSCERPDYFENLEIVSRLCREAGLPFVQIILSVPHFAYRDPNEADLRWQIYTTLAYGAKGIIYFTYVTPPDGGFYRNAIIDENGQRSEKYEHVQRLNRMLQALAPLLVQLEVVRVVHTEPAPRKASRLDDQFPVVSAAGMPMTLGWLKDGDGRSYLWVVNRSFDYQKGMIRSWELSGPHMAPGKTFEELQDVAFAPETAEGKHGHWPTVGVRVSGKADLLCLRTPPQNCVAYLRTRVKSATRQDAVLELGTSTNTKVWLNGQPVFSVGPGDQESKVRVALEPGWNVLLLKLTRGVGHMNAAARLVGPDGKPLCGLEIERDSRQSRDRADGAVVLRHGVKTVVEISQETGEPVKAAYDPGAHCLTVSLDPGEGRLFRLESSGLDAAIDNATPAASGLPADPSPDLRLDPNTSMTLEADRNGMPAGTELIATPSCLDYSLFPLVDGIRDRKELGWLGGSWASIEDASPHAVEIRLSKPLKGGCLQITWASEGTTHGYASRDYCVQVKAEADDPWKTVADVKGNLDAIGRHPLPNEPFAFLRVYQLAGGGCSSRPNIMWIGQIELLADRATSPEGER
jgi:hypothetical protein